ncbi:hypothetical protein GCM10011375_31780 [Hymenobacter qilianensis]|nr:hypothetical protein GCM10011375_31780 [Hymenobacter qilianensis]
MLLGDSITHGTPEHTTYRRPLWLKLQEEKYDVDFVGSKNTNEGGATIFQDFDPNHDGASGLRADELLPYIPEWAAYAQPDIVLLHAGTNDLLGTSSVEDTRDDIGKLIDALRAVNPKVSVLVAQVLPTDLTNNDVQNKIPAFNALLPALASAKTTDESSIIIVDHYTGFGSEDLYDKLHPNEQGEEKMAERWLAALKSNALLGRPLPVSLVQFDARAVPDGIQLQWVTASEQNNAGFTIERSTTGTEFAAVGQVVGRGTTASRSSYSFLDATALTHPKIYYRLRQTDTNGVVRFSGVVTVSPIHQSELTVSPVPADRIITVSGIVSQTPITIWNGRGQVVDRQVAEGTQITLDISQLSQGLYYLQAGTRRVRFIKH